MLCWPIGFVFVGCVFAVAALHLSRARYDISGGWFHIVIPYSNGDERRWKTHRQTRTFDDSHRFFQWPLSFTGVRIFGMLILRILQFRCVDAAMESGYVHHLFDTMPIQQSIS